MPRTSDETCIQCESGTLKKEVRILVNINTYSHKLMLFICSLCIKYIKHI